MDRKSERQLNLSTNQLDINCTSFFFPFAPSSCKLDLKLSTDKLGVSLSAERLGALDRSTESTVNDDLRKDTKGTGNTEEDGVVVGLGKTVVLEEDTRVLQRVSKEFSHE